MTDEKKKRDEVEASEQELDEVSGGVTGPSTHSEMTLTKQYDPATPQVADQATTGGLIDPVKIDFGSRSDDEDD